MTDLARGDLGEVLNTCQFPGPCVSNLAEHKVEGVFGTKTFVLLVKHLLNLTPQVCFSRNGPAVYTQTTEKMPFINN